MTRYIGLITMTDTTQAETAIREVLDGYMAHQSVRWGIRLKGSARVVGTVGFLNVSERNLRAELGYDLARRHWGDGIISEAVRAVVSFGFHSMRLHRVEADVHPDNNASAKVLERLGFSFEGVLRDYLLMKGNFETVRRYSLVLDASASAGDPADLGQAP